jgi:hypothetical protein
MTFKKKKGSKSSKNAIIEVYSLQDFEILLYSPFVLKGHASHVRQYLQVNERKYLNEDRKLRRVYFEMQGQNYTEHMLTVQLQKYGRIEKIYIKKEDDSEPEHHKDCTEVSFGFVAFFSLEATHDCLKNRETIYFGKSKANLMSASEFEQNKSKYLHNEERTFNKSTMEEDNKYNLNYTIKGQMRPNALNPYSKAEELKQGHPYYHTGQNTSF